ncbi:cytochrome c biogenesis protein ResB [Jeotgalibacillus proteolyticus]|uniref:Cytochrome C biogenesis protein n=1 Tax=Jeotgalibacillus proteolyticus TaxID=2082395 RepID=A0A2S5GE24_9BACL|nr:cytochrome c biogenesis protein ResB [Jeotgalibacillus proteolyticus]PPA71297.1 cytochrome C biogenesis protein [Jeotgalibacillus proteolyticus]
MSEITCKCGHVNPEGTELCLSCGRALTTDAEEKKTSDVMRYEGMARRSQTYNGSIIDKVWNFFSSVKVGVWLIVITLSASALGTIFPQVLFISPLEAPEVYYEERYGVAGEIYYILGFHDLYNSWWYLLLIAAIGTSIIIASLDRVIPLYKALKHQRVNRHASFMKRQRIYTEYPLYSSDTFSKIKDGLRNKRYRIREEDGNLLAEKGRFSRWGPYVNHTGLIIFLIGAMLRFVPGMYVDEVMWIREGETMAIPGTDQEYFLKSEGFTVETYDADEDKEVFGATIDRVGAIAKNFQTDAILLKREDGVAGDSSNLVEVEEHPIRVNQPFKFDNFALYQVDFRQGEFRSMSFNLVQKESGDSFGPFEIDLTQPEDEYQLDDDHRVELMGYYPDFSGFENGEPQSPSPVPNNPAFLFKLFSPEHPDGEVAFIAIQQNLEPLGENDYQLSFNGVETRDVSGLTVRKDLTLWILALGGAIFMIGVVQGAYWNHRRVWVKRTEEGGMLVSGHTNKNWFGLRKDLEAAFTNTGLEQPKDQHEQNLNKVSAGGAKEEENRDTTS